MADLDRRPATQFTLAGEPLPLLDPTRVYVCGITPYDVTHLGHASTFVWTDFLTRVLRDLGVTPVTARNVTDVDDVLTAAAHRAGAHADRFAYLQQYDFDRDMAALAVRRPDHEPRARHHVAGVQRLAQLLLYSGKAYTAEGSVYFDGTGTAEQAGLDETEALALAKEYGDRPDEPAKRHPLDVAVWQSSTGDEPSWPSPWGDGRPGWHAECAAMAVATFGPSLDIHAGGADLTFPHHAYESAMVEAVTGVRPFARRWFRVGVVGVGGAKMAKSTGNLVLVDDLLADHPAQVIRMLLLDRPWAAGWDFRPEDMNRAATRLDALRVAAGRQPAGRDATADAATTEVRAKLADDLDVPRALDIAVEAGGPAAQRLVDLLNVG